MDSGLLTADFAQLRQQEQKGHRKAPRSVGRRQLFRRRESGAWRDELTPQQVARIEADHADMMWRLGYEFTSARLALTG